MMNNAVRNVARKLLTTESPWNPKVIAGRATTALLPDRALRAIKKAYYAALLARLPEDFMERDGLVVKYLVSAGDQVVDIGASIGVYTKLLSHLVGPQGRVWSFEPIAQTFEFLAHSVRKLHLENVELVRSAVSDNDGLIDMVIPTYRWGADCYYDARVASAEVYHQHSAVQPTWKTEGVTTTTLDSFFKNQEIRISFIKCDANYHELACLRGGLCTLRDSKPAMLIEVEPDPDNPETTAFKTFSLLRGEGYGVYCLSRGTLHSRRVGERSQNYFFLLPVHVAKLRAKGLASLAFD
jgi:FkbM family methyltransferase